MFRKCFINDKFGVLKSKKSCFFSFLFLFFHTYNDDSSLYKYTKCKKMQTIVEVSEREDILEGILFLSLCVKRILKKKEEVKEIYLCTCAYA